jgi:hypothetical protein
MTGNGIDVLDCRHPIEWTLQSPVWRDTVRAWTGDPEFILAEVARAAEQDTIRALFPERRFVQPLPPELPAPVEWTAEVVHEEPPWDPPQPPAWEPPTAEETDGLAAIWPDDPPYVPGWQRLLWRLGRRSR